MPVSKRKLRPRPRLVLQPATRRTARYTSIGALRRFFALADAWELSPLQQCRLLKIPSPQVLERYRLGQAPRLSAAQHERIALLLSIQASLGAAAPGAAAPGATAPGAPAADATAANGERAWVWVNEPRNDEPFAGDSPLYFMLENGLPALREVARLLVRETRPR